MVADTTTDEGGISGALTLEYSYRAVEGDLLGLLVQVDAEDALASRVRDVLVEEVQQNEVCLHLVKVMDSLIQKENEQIASRIYSLECLLREALSILMLSVSEGDYYQLLGPSQVSTLNDMPKAEDLEKALENEFSYISFSDYRNVINRKLPSKIQDVFALIQASTSYDEFRAGLQPHVTAPPESVAFIASLNTVLDPIEKARNAVAHNRKLTKTVRENFHKAADDLEVIMEEFFASL